MLARGFDVPEVHLKDPGNPRGFHPAAAFHGLGLAGVVVETAKAGAEDGRDHGRPQARRR